MIKSVRSLKPCTISGTTSTLLPSLRKTQLECIDQYYIDIADGYDGIYHKIYQCYQNAPSNEDFLINVCSGIQTYLDTL